MISWHILKILNVPDIPKSDSINNGTIVPYKYLDMCTQVLVSTKPLSGR